MFRPGGESSRNLWQRHLVCMSARPFTEPEYLTLSQHFASAHRTRDRLLLILGCATGYRIQELLSLTVGQVWDGADVVREITVARKDLKGGRGGKYVRAVKGRRVPLSEAVRGAVLDHLTAIGPGEADRFQFATGRSHDAGMNRSQAFRVLVDACTAFGIDTTRVSTHSLRKTFVGRCCAASGCDLIKTQRAVRQSSPITIARYLETDTADLDRLVLTLAA